MQANGTLVVSWFFGALKMKDGETGASVSPWNARLFLYQLR